MCNYNINNHFSKLRLEEPRLFAWSELFLFSFQCYQCILCKWVDLNSDLHTKKIGTTSCLSYSSCNYSGHLSAVNSPEDACLQFHNSLVVSIFRTFQKCVPSSQHVPETKCSDLVLMHLLISPFFSSCIFHSLAWAWKIMTTCSKSFWLEMLELERHVLSGALLRFV